MEYRRVMKLSDTHEVWNCQQKWYTHHLSATPTKLRTKHFPRNCGVNNFALLLIILYFILNSLSFSRVIYALWKSQLSQYIFYELILLQYGKIYLYDVNFSFFIQLIFHISKYRYGKRKRVKVIVKCRILRRHHCKNVDQKRKIQNNNLKHWYDRNKQLIKF